MRGNYPTTYDGLRNYLGGRASRSVPNLASTRVVDTGAGIAVLYHGTPVVTHRPDGTVELRTGGWRTATTKARINQFSRVRVRQRNYEFLVSAGGAEQPFEEGDRFRN